MAEEKKPQSIAEEAGLPDNWVPVDTEPIMPGVSNGPAGASWSRGGAPAQGPQGYKSTSDMPPYFSGSINPDMAHDSDYVRSQIASPAVPTVPLMPVAASGKPSSNAAITSIVKTITTSVPDLDPFLLFRGTWQSFISYAINDVVVQNLSTYVATQSSNGLRPDQNPGSWTILGENLVFNPSPGNFIGTGGFSLYDTGAIAQGLGTSFSVTGTPSGAGEIALLTVVESNGGNSITAGLSGWTQITNRGGQWSYWYMVLPNANPVTASGTLSISDDWIASLDFFKFGGFAFVSISNVAVNAANQATINIGNSSGLIVAGQQVVFSGVGTATFLNGQSVNVTTASATQMTCTIAPGHANYASTPDTGKVSVILQQIGGETSGALFPPSSFNLVTSPKVGNIIVFTNVAAGIFAGGGNLSGYSDLSGNAYTGVFALNTSGGAHFTLNQAYSTPNKAASSATNFFTVGGGSDLTSSGGGLIELAGSAAIPLYEPYDVVQFRGSMFVCLLETTNDAFQQPAAWALIGPGLGFVDQLSADYTAVASDTGRLLSMNSSSAHTITLPNPVPAPPAGVSETGWMIFIQNIGTGTLTIARNGLTIDGAAANLTLGQNQGVLIFADSTGNYETLHGMNSLVMPNIFTVTVPNGSGQVTVGLATEAANTFWGGPTSGAAATPTFRLLVNADLPVTVPTVPPEFTLTGNVASPAGALAIGKATEPANTVWAAPDGASGQPTFRKLVAGDIPTPLPPSAIAVAIGTLITHSVSGTLRLPGNVIPPAGVYRVHVYFELAANPAAGMLDVNIGWTDAVSATNATNGTLGAPVDISTAALNKTSGVITVVSDGIHDITWAMTLT